MSTEFNDAAITAPATHLPELDGRELRHAKAQVKALLHAAVDGIVLIDTRGNVEVFMPPSGCSGGRPRR